MLSIAIQKKWSTEFRIRNKNIMVSSVFRNNDMIEELDEKSTHENRIENNYSK